MAQSHRESARQLYELAELQQGYFTTKQAKASGFAENRLAEQTESTVVEGHLQPDHVHMLLSIPPKHAVSQVIGFMKGKSAIHLARTYRERKQNFVGQSFWARGFLVSTVGRDEAVVREYIRNQEKEDRRLEQLKMWQRPATDKVAQQNRGRVSDPAQAALSGSHRKAPSLSGGYLLIELMTHHSRAIGGRVRLGNFASGGVSGSTAQHGPRSPQCPFLGADR